MIKEINLEKYQNMMKGVPLVQLSKNFEIAYCFESSLILLSTICELIFF